MSEVAKTNSLNLRYGKIFLFTFDLSLCVALILSSLYLTTLSSNVAVWICALLLIGANLHRLSILGHDLVHYLVFKNRKMNILVANLFIFYPLGVCAEGYQEWHFRHHRNAGSQEDPELDIKSGYFYTPPKSHLFFVLTFILDCFGLGTPEVFKLIKLVKPKKGSSYIPLVLFWCLIGYFVITRNFLPQLGLYVASIFTSFWAYFRVRNWSEHIGIQGTHRFHAPLILRYFFFPFNTWCHFEHHENPVVNYQNLRILRSKIMEPKIISTSDLFDFFSHTHVKKSKTRTLPRQKQSCRK